MENSTQPDIVYLVHQRARLSKDPRKPHNEALNKIGPYLKGTDKMGIYIRHLEIDGKVWGYADFRGNWFPEEAKDDSYMVRSCLVFF